MTGNRAITHPKGDEPEDVELALRAARGDRSAFGTLYRRHINRVYTYVVFRIPDGEAAEDVTQEVFLRAYTRIGDLRDYNLLLPWLYRIAHNLVLNHWRDARPTEPWPEGPAEPIDDDGSFALVDDRLDSAEVVRAASGITELQQQVVALRFVAGLSVAETAEVMGRSPSAVKNLQHHALAALRRGVDAGRALRR